MLIKSNLFMMMQTSVNDHKFTGVTLTASYLYGLALKYGISACDVYGCDAYIGLNPLGQHVRYTFKF